MVTTIEAKPKIAIVWKYPPEQFPYLREGLHITNKAVGKIHGWSGDRYRWVKTLEELKRYSKHFEETRARGVETIQEIRFLMVGYEEVERDGSGLYFRRYLWLKSYDRAVLRNGIYKDRMPCEATTLFANTPISLNRRRKC